VIVENSILLCSLCKRLNWQQIFSLGTFFDHHKTYSDLAISANQGCEFCAVAHIAVLDAHSQELSLPVEDVVQLHLEQDRLESWRTGKGRSRFVLIPVRVDFDTRFAPFSEGFIGILYRRVLPNGDAYDVVESVHLFISVSAVEGT
jgi:hypothetical protein